jgi:hypothetical protein
VQQNLGVLGAAERRHDLAWQRKGRGQHADDLERLSIERHRAANDGRVAAVAAHPRAVIEDSDAGAARGILVFGEQTPERGPRAQHRQKVRRDPDRADALRLAVTRQVVVATDRDRDLLEPQMSRLDVEILRRGKPVFRDAQARRSAPDDREAFRVLIRQRAQEQRARDAEDGRVGADADGDRHQGREREPGVPGKRADRVAQILHQSVHRFSYCEQEVMRPGVLLM